MSELGIILLCIILIPSLTIIFCRNILIKLDIKYFWILLIFSLVCFIYFVVARYIPDAIDFNSFKEHTPKQMRDIYYSKLLLLDLCPFMAFALPIITIFDKKRRFARLLAPVTIIGSLVTLFGQCIWINGDDLMGTNLWTYVFIGDQANRLYFMMHLLSLFLGLWVLMVAPTFTWKSCTCSYGSLAIWLVYTIAMMKIFNVQWNVTGLSENDWLFGEYNKVYAFWSLPFPDITIFWYFVAVLFNFLIIYIVPNNFMHFNKFVHKHVRFNKKLKM